MIDGRKDANTALHLDDLERQAIAAYLRGADESSEELWTRAHSESLHSGDLPRAARCVFWIVLDLFNRGEWSRGNGWLARGQHLLGTAQDSAAFGLLSVLASRHHLKQGDTDAAAEAATRAMDLAGRHEDPELSIFARLSLALVQARRGRFPDAASLFDEIMVGVTVDHVSPIAVGVVYCAVIDACRSLLDLGRAREWTTALGRWCATQPDMVAFRGKCLVHRSEIMRFSGAWSEALSEAERACAWSDEHPDSFKYPAGAAFYELAEIRRLRGEFDAAEAAYQRAGEHGHSPEPGLTLLQFALGKLGIASATVRRLMSEGQSVVNRAAVLHAAAEILATTGDLETARTAADELERISQQYPAPAARALAAHAGGAVSLAEGDSPAALAGLRRAWTLWQELDVPYEAARVRVLLGQVCALLGDQATAELEYESARRFFERVSAAPDMARVDALRHRRTGRDAHTLTPREQQVIKLVATGQTNRAIARRLSISERTADRHVSNILRKLQLPSRSAATAYAWQHDLVEPTG